MKQSEYTDYGHMISLFLCCVLLSLCRRFERVAQEDFKVPHLQLEPLCCYLAELSILDYKAVKFVPSMLAASAVFLARFIVHPKQHPWVSIFNLYNTQSLLSQAFRMRH